MDNFTFFMLISIGAAPLLVAFYVWSTLRLYPSYDITVGELVAMSVVSLIPVINVLIFCFTLIELVNSIDLMDKVVFKAQVNE